MFIPDEAFLARVAIPCPRCRGGVFRDLPLISLCLHLDRRLIGELTPEAEAGER